MQSSCYTKHHIPISQKKTFPPQTADIDIDLNIDLYIDLTFWKLYQRLCNLLSCSKVKRYVVNGILRSPPHVPVIA